MLRVTLNGLASHPRGSRNTPSHFMLATKTGISFGLMSHLACMQIFFYIIELVEKFVFFALYTGLLDNVHFVGWLMNM